MHKHKNPITNTNREIAQTNDLAIVRKNPSQEKNGQKKNCGLQLSYPTESTQSWDRLDHTMLP
jgi:hypothetical protein